jgi:[protein-PII] uridylyltransferase
MAGLLEKITESAAKRLPLPPQRVPSQELSRYKNFLKVEGHRLKILHRGGASGREICRARAHVLDELLRHLVDAVRQQIAAPAGGSAWALVAIGGYGRGELNPHSDIDFMFLHDGGLMSRGQPSAFLKTLADSVLYTLWDVGLKVGHATRSIGECVTLANGDMQSKTSLIESRLIAGNESLYKGMQKLVLERCVRGHEDAYIRARIEDQTARRARFGNSPLMQEPNLKNGCGGLRDYQNLLWMSFFKFSVHRLEELEQRQLITPVERRELDHAHDFLLRARNELHYQADRPVDALSKSLQPTVAYYLGYTDRSPVVRLERFMRDYYTHARNVHMLTRTLEQRWALMRPQRRLAMPSIPSIAGLWRGRGAQGPVQTVDGLQVCDGELRAQSPRVLQEHPRRLMRLFLHAQQRGLRLHPEVLQYVRQNLHLVDRKFIEDPHVRETFLEILNQRGNVAPILRAMHEADFLGKYLPEFGRLTCLVQHEFYHQYTADEHTLVCIEKLDQIWGSTKAPFKHYAEMFRNLERPQVLYLALLLHDAGKGSHSGPHEAAGKRLALRAARRLRLDAATTQTLGLLIEHHLLLTQVSQRRDLDDARVISDVAAKVRTSDNLVLLALHTFADSLGTSDKLWNDFKESLLWNLCNKTMKVLTGGTDFVRAEEQQRQQLAADVRPLLPRAVQDDEVQAHFAHLPPRYFQIHPAREVAADILLAHRFMALQWSETADPLTPVMLWHNEADRGFASVKVCTWNRPRLFSKIAGCLTAAGLNILSAQIFTRGDGMILDTFFVQEAQSGKLPGRDERDSFENLLTSALTTDADVTQLIAGRPAVRSLYQSLEGERIPTAVRVDNTISDTRTVIDVETEDRVGLLYVLSHTLADLDLDLSVAKICTEKGAAIDSFYVSEGDGSKLLSGRRIREVETALRHAVAALDPA